MKQVNSEPFLRKMKKLKTAQAVNLAIWAGLNILVAGIFIFQSEAHYFYLHAMNASWNLVNLFVAAFIYHYHNEIFKRRLSILKQMDYQSHIEKAIAFNLGFQ
ncbi:MAG: hypothetical protein R6V72_16220 [Cyclobacterium sp.]|uniref:DUF6992 family protein n=1 Tax=Cyclobacterium sp. TaxID=1966343 RepID=UPI0039705803